MKALASKIILSLILVVQVMTKLGLIVDAVELDKEPVLFEIVRSTGNIIDASEPTLMLDNFTENVKVCSSSNSKTYMDYRKITLESSEQYRFIKTFMSIDDGFLYDKDGFIGVALGSYFGDIGTRYVFTLDTGTKLSVVKIEEKADKHTIDGCYQKYDKSVIEFVIDSSSIKIPIGSNGYIANGNFNNLEEFSGSILKIEKVKISN